MLIYLAFYYRTYHIEQLTQQTLEDYEDIKEEIDQLVKDENNLRKISELDRTFLNELFKTYLEKKLLIFLVHDAKGNYLKVFTEQAISKQTLNNISPFINETDKVILQENIQLSFITIADLPNNATHRYTFIFDTINYNTAKQEFYRRFEIFFPLIFLPFILVSLIILGRGRFNLMKDSFKISDIAVFNDRKKEKSSSSLKKIQPVKFDQPPIDKSIEKETFNKKTQTTDIQKEPNENQNQPDGKNSSENEIFEESPKVSSLPEAKKTPSNQQILLRNNRLIELIKEFYFKRKAINIKDYHRPSKTVRTIDKIRDRSRFLQEQFNKSQLFKATIEGISQAEGLPEYLKRVFKALNQEFPDSVMLLLEKRQDIFKVIHTLPEECHFPELKEVFFTPQLGAEKKYYQQSRPFQEELAEPNDYMVLNLPLNSPDDDTRNYFQLQNYLVKLLMQKNSLDENQRFIIHHWILLLSKVVEHFQTFEGKKMELKNWFSKSYFKHLLKTYFYRLKDELKANDQPDKIIKLIITKQSAPKMIDSEILIELKDYLTKTFPKIIFSLQQETQTLWALTLGKKPHAIHSQPVSPNTPISDGLSSDSVENQYRPPGYSSYSHFTTSNEEVADIKLLSNTIKDYLSELLNSRKSGLRIATSTINFPSDLDSWIKIENNKTFWRSSQE